MKQTENEMNVSVPLEVIKAILFEVAEKGVNFISEMEMTAEQV